MEIDEESATHTGGSVGSSHVPSVGSSLLPFDGAPSFQRLFQTVSQDIEDTARAKKAYQHACQHFREG